MLDIKNHALNDVPNETCGLVIEKDNNYQYLPCRNISYVKTGMAVLDPFDYICASNQGTVVAHSHSHPKGGPSLQDNFSANINNIYSIVYSWQDNKYFVVEPKLKDYLNKEFKIPDSDCFALVRDYYRIEKNININDYQRSLEDLDGRNDLILNNFEKEGFYKVDISNMRKDDILFLAGKNGKIYHMGIFLDGDLILHHPVNSKSCIQNINDYYKKQIVSVVRHRNYE